MSSPWVQGGSFLVEGKRGQVLGMAMQEGDTRGGPCSSREGPQKSPSARRLNTSKFLASLDQVLSSFPLC